jgi:hypothetical protein
VYSDSAVADVECPFKPGWLRDLYEFSWDIVDEQGILLGPLPNNRIQGAYWLANEDNRTLHVNLSSAIYTRHLSSGFRCVGVVQTCHSTSSCTPSRPRPSDIPIFNVLLIGKRSLYPCVQILSKLYHSGVVLHFSIIL